MKKIIVAAALTLTVGSAPMASAKDEKSVELTAVELTAVQTRVYAAPVSATFPATVATSRRLAI